jgi:hypothetical protein
MHFTVVSPAKGDNEFIADLASERSPLGEAQMVRIRGLPTAYQARALADELDVPFISEPASFRERKHALVDLVGRWRDGNFVCITR